MPDTPHRLRVVVAEDEPVIAMELEAMLARLGHDVVGTAGDGPAALELVRRLLPDALLTDLRMPGCTGLEVAAQLVGEGHALPVIVLTAYEDDSLVDAAIAAGAIAYLMKPASEAQLAAALRLATRRFDEIRALSAEVQSLRDALESRKLIERAKGLLATHLGITEEESFRQLQKAARDRSITLVDAARRVIDAQALLRARDGKVTPTGLKQRDLRPSS